MWLPLVFPPVLAQRAACALPKTSCFISKYAQLQMRDTFKLSFPHDFNWLQKIHPRNSSWSWVHHVIRITASLLEVSCRQTINSYNFLSRVLFFIFLFFFNVSQSWALAAVTDSCAADRIRIESVELTWMKGSISSRVSVTFFKSCLVDSVRTLPATHGSMHTHTHNHWFDVIHCWK